MIERKKPYAELLKSVKTYLSQEKEAGVEFYLKKHRMTLKELREYISDCQRCEIAKNRLNLVFGLGNENAEIVFVGEAPGADEDKQGEPFVGKAGQLLTKIIKAMGFERSDVYITNILKCRPPENRDPLPQEVANCEPFLLKQLEIIKPKIIIALGKYASQTLLNTDIPITQLRGKFYDFHSIPLMSTFHPSFLLRNPNKKREVWEDMKKVLKRLKEV